MARSVPFRLNRSAVLLAFLCAAFAGQASAAAGRVDFAIGGATVVGTDGSTRPVTRGSELDSGDLVRTNDGRVQMRMTDGAFISLQPNTEFGIKDYKFEGRTDGSENAFFSLVKGAMRTVTGLIGRVNRNKYQVTTPTATVGIRGTGGLIQVLNDGSTLVQGTSGIWFLANPAGSIDIPAGVAGIAPVDVKQPPKETVQIPTAGPSPLPALLAFVQGEQREADGTSVITGVLQSGSGYAAVLAFGGTTDGVQAVLDPGIGIASFNGTGQMTQMDFSSRTSALFALQSGGSHADFGTDSIIAWGRWIGPVAVPVSAFSLGTENYDANMGLHYVVGMPTAAMPQTGGGTYTLLGATQPTYVDGLNAPGTLNGTLFVDFVKLTVVTDLSVAMSDGQNYAIGGIAQIAPGSPLFSGSTVQTLTATGGGCVSVCIAEVQGFFAGTSAERAGLGYQINDTGTQRDIVGAAAFTK